MKTGHFCKICGEYKSYENFSSDAHSAHICKECAKLPAEKQNEMLTINQLITLPLQLFKEERSWLEKMRNDESHEVRFALEDSLEPADTDYY